MPKNDLKSRSAFEQKPAPKVLHKRRTEADMRKALADFALGKPRLRDDEREVILEDAITEVIEMRRILMDMSQRLGLLHVDVTTGMKQILSEQ